MAAHVYEIPQAPHIVQCCSCGTVLFVTAKQAAHALFAFCDNECEEAYKEEHGITVPWSEMFLLPPSQN